jgi:glycosyltransferase involved in cell wall biosynthesis
VRILLLSQWFDPEPTFKGLLFARALTQRGHEVQVITGFPNYPGGKVYPGYKIVPIKREFIDGVKIIRVPLYPSHDRSALGRVLNYVTFALSASLAGVFSRFRADVVYVYHPPLTVGMAASLISLVRRVPFVYDIQDLWPDTLEATGMIRSQRLLKWVGRAATWVYARAQFLIAQSPGFVGRLTARGVAKERIHLIYNWCDEAALRVRSAHLDLARLGLSAGFKVIFAGNMGKAQSLKAVLDAASLVQAASSGVQFVFVGGGTEVEDLKSYAKSARIGNVLFLPRVPMEEIGHILDAADALLVHLRDSPLFEITLPSKTQAYLFAGKPIIMAVGGDAANIVRDAQAGVLAKPEDPRSIADAVLGLAALSTEERLQMGERGRAFYDEHLSLDVGTARMISLFNEAVAARRN